MARVCAHGFPHGHTPIAKRQDVWAGLGAGRQSGGLELVLEDLNGRQAIFNPHDTSEDVHFQGTTLVQQDGPGDACLHALTGFKCLIGLE